MSRVSLWGGILAFEWRYATRRLTFAAAAALFGLLGFALAATEFGAPDVHVNGPYAVTYALGFLSLAGVLAVTVLCAPALLRDSEHQMAEIVYATSVGKRQYLLGRLFGSYLAAATAFACAPLGMLCGTFLVAHDPARIAPFALAPYAWATAVLALPNLLFVAALLFGVAAATRSTLATYVGGVGLYVLYFVTALFTNSPVMAGARPTSAAHQSLAARLDPFGLSAFFEQTRYWTAAERNVRELALAGAFLQNRLIWLAVTGLVLALLVRLFALRLPVGSGRQAEAPSPVDSGRPTAYRPVPPAASAAGRLWPALGAHTWLELRSLVKSWPFAALLLMWVASAAIELVQSLRSAEFGTVLLPTTGLVIGRLAPSLRLFGLLMLAYYAAELVWRERALRCAELVDATPASSGVFAASKAAALALAVALLAGSGVATGVVVQAASGYHLYEPLVYAGHVYFSGLPLVLFAVLAVLLQTLSPNRHVGLLLTLLAVAFWHRGGFGGPQHPLLRYAAAPDVPYSAMAGFGPQAASFHWFMAYWTVVAAVLGLVACGVWRRGTEAGLLSRLARLPRRLGQGGRLAFGAGVLAAALLGALVFRQTNVVHAYETEDSRLLWKAGYERTYGELEGRAQPSLVSLRTQLDLFPEERRYRARGRYQLENRTAEAIRTVWVAARRELRQVELSLAGAAPARHDARFGMYAFELETPLEPGAQAELRFDVTVERGGASAGEPQADVMPDASFILGTSVFPSIGYRATYELTDPGERRSQGLEARTRTSALEDSSAADVAGGDPARFTFEATVSTPSDQVAVAPGALLASWEQGGRRYFRFGAEHPVRPFLGFAAARYAVRRELHAGVEIEVFYQPGHERNVPRMLAAAARALDYCGTRFGPYTERQLRIAEVPSYALPGAALALPGGAIFYAEQRGFLTDLSDPRRVDIVTKRVAHEVAHQWWGHQLAPRDGPGATALVETLARYTELMVLKDLYGEAALQPVLEVELDRYLSGRTGGDEVPLHEVEDQAYLYYAKGALVMTALRDLIGEDAVNRALGTLLAEARTRNPTVADLLEQLRAVTPEAQRPLLDAWWTRIVLYDLRVASAGATALPDGRFRVDVRIEAARSLVQDGRESPLGLDEQIELAVFAGPPEAPGAENVLYSERQRVRGATELSLTVARPPAYVAIDPYLRRIDRDRTDNVRPLEPAGP